MLRPISWSLMYSEGIRKRSFKKVVVYGGLLFNHPCKRHPFGFNQLCNILMVFSGNDHHLIGQKNHLQS